MISFICIIVGYIIFWTACYYGKPKEYQPNNYDSRSRMADLGFWLCVLGIVILWG